MKYILFSFVALLIFTTSCQKSDNNGPTVVSGTIVENGSMKPISGADVWITAQDRHSTWSGGLGGGASGSRYQKSDTNGHFSFTLNVSNDSLYQIWPRANPALYFDGAIGNDGILFNVENQDTKNRLVRVNPKGWIRFHVINEPPLDTLTDLSISMVNGPILFNFFSKDTILISKYQLGGKINNFAWWVQKKDSTSLSRYIGEIYVKPLDTVDYIIKY